MWWSKAYFLPRRRTSQSFLPRRVPRERRVTHYKTLTHDAHQEPRICSLCVCLLVLRRAADIICLSFCEVKNHYHNGYVRKRNLKSRSFCRHRYFDCTENIGERVRMSFQFGTSVSTTRRVFMWDSARRGRFSKMLVFVTTLTKTVSPYKGLHPKEKAFTKTCNLRHNPRDSDSSLQVFTFNERLDTSVVKVFDGEVFHHRRPLHHRSSLGGNKPSS